VCGIDSTLKSGLEGLQNGTAQLVSVSVSVWN
jgi:X-X-X-Leu-X-X-Gly heptad repeat protein